MFAKIVDFFKSKPTEINSSLKNLNLLGRVSRKKIGFETKEISLEASLSMQIEDEKKFIYTLLLKNEDNKDEWNTFKFNITNELSFKLLKENSHCSLVWNRNAEFFIFQILIDPDNDSNLEPFLKTLSSLVCSSEYLAHPSAINEEDADEYLLRTNVESIDNYLEDNYNKYYTSQEYLNNSKINSNKIIPNSKYNEKEEDEIININQIDNITNKFAKKIDIKTYCFSKANPTAISLFSASGILLCYDSKTDNLEVISDNADFLIYKLDDFEYNIVVDEEDSKKTHTCSRISQETNLVMNKKENCVLWLGKDSNVINAYNFIFDDKEKLEKLKTLLTKSHYESSNKNKYEELKQEDREWLENANNNELDASYSANDIEMDLETEFLEDDTGGNNISSAQAYLHDRTFVVRDDNVITVYKSEDDHSLKHILDLPPLKKFENKEIKLKDAKLFMGDTNLLLLDTLHPSTAYRFDLQKGKIVEEWDCSDNNIKIEDLCMEKKLDQMTNNSIVNCFDSNNLFCLDSRIDDKNKIVVSKNYKSNPKFSCIATNSFGGIAIGSGTGEIRLFKEFGKNAKTLLPSLGDPIKSIDVTMDGKYVLATCDKYLILINTVCKGQCTGFDVQMGKEKPYPKILKINAIDLKKYGLERYKFTPARFNISDNSTETNIITSLGDHIINWNFSKIRKGIFDDYKIKKFHENIYDNKFKYNSNQIVSTMEHKLRIQKQNIN